MRFLKIALSKLHSKSYINPIKLLFIKTNKHRIQFTYSKHLALNGNRIDMNDYSTPRVKC